jgi:DNA-binding winged helix-turn-helix (wHTH) protein
MKRISYCYRFGSVEYDEGRGELRVAGLPVEVERRALEVLAYLLRHAGEVVTKEELLREVWAGRITVDKVLPNAINKLRRALGAGNADRVATQARVGYRLDGPIQRTVVGRQPASELALAPGQAVPGRDNFLLQRPLGKTRGSEVWLAVHAKTHEPRVYKFGLDSDRLRALKREATLLRLLHESLADASRFVGIIDWNFEQPPYFLECEYGGRSLAEWALDHLPSLTQEQRIELLLQIADAVAAAHSIGVLHKDLKPANVLIDDAPGTPRVRLTDFGSGRLLDPDRLAQLGITQLGMTVTETPGTDPESGTLLYIAPEIFAGQSPTVRSDVFALGILMYQVLSGNIAAPMVSGWEQNIADPLLQDDLRRATDGNPERRLASVAELAARLRSLDARRHEAAEMQLRNEESRRAHELLARTRARRPLLVALIAVLALATVVSLVLQQAAMRARNDARSELARTAAVTRFVTDDLIGRSNPLVTARGANATVKEALLAARDRVASRFANQPDAEATIRTSLASLFNTMDLWPEAEVETRRALALYETERGPSSEDALRARSVLARVMSRQGRTEDAKAEIARLEELTRATEAPASRYLLSSARSAYFIAIGDFAKATPELRTAIDEQRRIDAGDTALLDSLRLDLIASQTMSAEYEAARAQARSLIDEALSRDEDSSLMIALARLAMARTLKEDHSAAEALLLEAQPVIVARLGEDHSRHLQLLGELLGVAFRRADWPRAVSYAQQVHERVRARYGKQHALTWVTLGNWGRSLYEAGDAKQAAPHLRKAHARLVALSGAASPQAQDVGFLLVGTELELGNDEVAETLLATVDVEVLEAGRATGMWPFGLDALRGMLLQQRGDATAARPLLQSAIAGMKSEEDLDAPSRLYAQATRALASLP